MCLSAEPNISLLRSFQDYLGSWVYKHLVPPGPKTRTIQNRPSVTITDRALVPLARDGGQVRHLNGRYPKPHLPSTVKANSRLPGCPTMRP